MTIGSTYNHPAANHPYATNPIPWSARYPNPPDLCFDYRRLLESGAAVGRATQSSHRICIVGAGITGLTAARELLRCGFTEVTLIEQSRRIGGRHMTVTAGPNSSPFEMGAMRMPFFNRSGEPPKSGRSLMAYYAELFDLTLSDFPNPGSPFVTGTGIFLREGQLAGEDEPRMLIWRNPEGDAPPPDLALRAVYEKWHRFANRMTEQVAKVFGSADWPSFWAGIVARYEHMSFRDMVRLPAIDQWRSEHPYDFGGLGMDEEESSIFYAIGIGDGSWGAFYDVCCLYPLRTAIFGFSSHLQLIHGRVDEQGRALPAAYLDQNVFDSQGLRFDSPHYIGLAALDESMLYFNVPGRQGSLYEHLLARPEGLLTDSAVTGVAKQPDGSLRVRYEWNRSGVRQVRESTFDSVIVTVPSWIMETRMQLEGFSEAQLPGHIIRAYKTAHWETSCKVYAPLKKRFLREALKIPQILVTDSFVHDVYAYGYNDHYRHDAILLSYTWEDDATKLAVFSDQELVDKCLVELDRILLKCGNIAEPISPYVDRYGARVQRWITDGNAQGCAKLYRAGTYQDALSLMAYNRNHAASSGLYLAGESFSVDAGWTEPCLRTAMDAVINICANTGAAFEGKFSMDVYPQYVLAAVPS